MLEHFGLQIKCEALHVTIAWHPKFKAFIVNTYGQRNGCGISVNLEEAMRNSIEQAMKEDET
jgi:hypothetical protein